MGKIRTTLLVLCLAMFLSVSAVGTASASSGEYVVDLECPEPSEAALDQNLTISEDYIDCVVERKEAELTKNGLPAFDNLRSLANQVGSVGQFLENSRFSHAENMGESITAFADKQHERIDAEEQARIDSTALEEREDQIA